jgi:enoyl-CoA hydratase
MLKKEDQDGILIITIDREKALNAINTAVMDGLREVFVDTDEWDQYRGIIITGSGSKAFAAGADIKEFPNYGEKEGAELSRKGHQVYDAIENCTVPVLAVINGFSLGGGNELAMACHMRIAEEHAKFGQPEINLGLIPGYAGTQRFVRYVGKAKAIELLLTGDMIGAQEASERNLVNSVVESGEGLATGIQLMRKIASKSKTVVAHMLRAVHAYHSYEPSFDIESQTFGACFELDDMKEGVAAFMEKRKPDFKN